MQQSHSLAPQEEIACRHSGICIVGVGIVVRKLKPLPYLQKYLTYPHETSHTYSSAPDLCSLQGP